ncbi:CGNR zinc finger domain-containing protein [Kribbella sp. HUAS MG21]|jgi:predicted RNA-binding Zn ribbon-like protein|uniref:CGNR zinc finger domain-containing protein n=1 Tax=Kribbella sp. HUAS MG21 TaxID=3160966 RepID=A0AAU7TA65_9ACTN
MSAVSAPLLGEPLPIELANTAYAVRGEPREGLDTVEALADWLEANNDRLPWKLSPQDLAALGDFELTAARELRDAIRTVASAITDDDTDGAAPSGGAIETINHHARWAPQWQELQWEAEPAARVRSAAPPVTATFSYIAQAAIELFVRQRADLRACQGPGCVLFYLQDRPQRRWCSAACGNRARAARHYARHR